MWCCGAFKGGRVEPEHTGRSAEIKIFLFLKRARTVTVTVTARERKKSGGRQRNW